MGGSISLYILSTFIVGKNNHIMHYDSLNFTWLVSFLDN